jgi:hypothetical protein
MDAAHAYGLKTPVVEIGYAPLHSVRQSLPCPDASVIASLKMLIVSVTLAPPALGALFVGVLLTMGGH